MKLHFSALGQYIYIRFICKIVHWRALIKADLLSDGKKMEVKDRERTTATMTNNNFKNLAWFAAHGRKKHKKKKFGAYRYRCCERQEMNRST